MKVEYFNPNRVLKPDEIPLIAEFLHNELEQYGDSCNDITKAICHAMKCTNGNQKGVVAVMSDSNQIIGAAVVNSTGMEDYIPENILVYIAIHHKYRGHGFGKQLLSAVLKQVEGDVALHVDPVNPAIHMYNSIGFKNKYIEMRLSRKE